MPPTLKRGPNHTYLLDGQLVPSVTQVLQAMAKPALVPWAAKVCAEQSVNRWDELSELPLSERINLIKRFPTEDRDQAANQGTKVHQLAAELSAGRQVTIPEHLTGHVTGCIRFLDDVDPQPLAIEAAVASTRYKYAGTLDQLARIEGRTILLDWKTNRSGPFGEVALQLAAYAGCDLWPDGPAPSIDELWVVWLRADGTYEVHLVQEPSPAYNLTAFLHLLHFWRLWCRPDVDPRSHLAILDMVPA